MGKVIYYDVYDADKDELVLEGVKYTEVTKLTGCKAPDRAILRECLFNGRWKITEHERIPVPEKTYITPTWFYEFAFEWDCIRKAINKKAR